MSVRPRILFFSEAVTRASVVRPIVLADSLKGLGYEVHFASAYRYETLFKDKPFTYWPLESVSYQEFTNSVGGGRSAYGDEQVESYLMEEEGLIREIQPDLIVSDTRMTVGISAPSCGVRVANINNAYWSPYRKDPVSPVPAYHRSAVYNMFPKNIADWVMPYGLVRGVYPMLKPVFERSFLAPFNRARVRRNLKAFKDFETFYTWGDWTLFCETPELVPVVGAPGSHRYLGPLLWPSAGPGILPQQEGSRPTVYVRLGSSNEVSSSRELVEELAKMDINLLVATAGRFEIKESERIHVAESHPGMEACSAASVVLSSGGSTAAYHALAAGRPVVGLPSNMDQYLSMEAIERKGAGLSIRSDQVTPIKVREAVERVLSDGRFKARAEEMAESFRKYDAPTRFREFIVEVLPQKEGVGRTGVDLQTLPGRWRRRAETTPGKPAFWGLEERKAKTPALTYGEVWQRVQQLALGLKDLGLERGERVGILAGVGPEWELMQGAILLAGGAVVGLDLHDAPERVANAANQSGVRGWVVGSEEVVRDRPDLLGGRPRFVVVLRGSAPGDHPNVMAFDHLLNRHQGKSWTEPFPKPEDLATILFTSGTTGEPKGIAYTHAQLIHAVRAIVRAYRHLPEGFESVCWLPLSNLFQRIVNLCAMERSAVITFVGHPNELMNSLPLVRPDVLIGVPRFYEKVEEGVRKNIGERGRTVRALFDWSVRLNGRYRQWKRGGRVLRWLIWPAVKIVDRFILTPVRGALGGRVRFLVSGSAPVGRGTLEFFDGLGLLILEAYGTSENTVPVSVNRESAFSFGTTGKPLAPNEVEIGKGRQVMVKGPGLFGGYWGKPIDGSLFQSSYYQTGDEGEWREGGFLKLLGRRSEFIKTSTGRRVAPGPIEEWFKAVPFVDQVVALGNGRKGPAVLVTVDGKALGEGGDSFTTETREHVAKVLRERARGLPELSRPHGILVLNRAFSVLRGEMTANLKLRRQAIETNYGEALDGLYEKGGGEFPVMRFLGSAEARMQEFHTIPKLTKIETRFVLRWMRLARLLFRGLGWYGRYAYELFQRPWDYRALQGLLLERLVRDYRETVGPLKGPLVKIGQTLSYVELGLPVPMQKFLAEMQEKSPPLEGKEAGRVIRESLGRGPGELFEEWHDTPFAAASMSQIHLARLKDGRRVAVKVRYPGIEEAVKTDLMAVRMMLPLISRMTGIENVGENFREARKLFLGECDFRREAAFMGRFREIFAGHPRIGIPEVFPAYSSESVLTMEYVEGQNFAEFLATASTEAIDQAGESIYEFFSVAALRHGLFHADPHPGNYLFQNGRVYILDFGFCKEWSKDFVELWKQQSRAVIENDVAGFTDATMRMGLRRKDVPLDYAALLQSYRLSVHAMNLENQPFRFTREFVRKMTQVMVENQIGLKRVYSPPDVLAFSRLFWGQMSVLAEMGSNIDCYGLGRIHLYSNE